MESTSRVETHKEAASAAAKRAREIAEKAESENRSLTAAEEADYRKAMGEARHNLDQLKTARRDPFMTDLKALADELAGRTPAGRGGRKGTHSPWAKATAERMSRAMTAEVDGQKALVSGSIGVPVPLETDVVALSSTPRSLLELVPVRMLTGGFGTGNSFSFLRQTVRTNNAAPVADGALKPSSVFTLAEIEDRVRVIAHLSDPVPERYFADHAALEDFLQAEMEAGILDALQDQVVNGDGEGENLTGILATTGVISQVFATDRLTSIRKGLTQLQATGVTPNALVLNPADLEALDLLRADGATGAFLLGDPAAESATNIWSVPRIPSNAVAAGTALLADWNQAEIVVREDATLALDRSGVNFTKNLVTLRVEGRFGLAIKRPASFAVIDLAA